MVSRISLNPLLTMMVALLVVFTSVEIEAAKKSKPSSRGTSKRVHYKKGSKRKHRRSRACNTVVGKHQAWSF